MPTAAQNKQTILDAYTAMSSGDIKGFMALLDRDIVVREPDSLPYGGVYRGVTELMGMFAKAAPVLDSSRLVVKEATAEDDRVVALIRVPVRASEAVALIAEHWRLRDGKAVELSVFWADPAIAGTRSPSAARGA
jgi:ketosteroid isomerase-like protein